MFAAICLPNFSLQAVLRHETDLRAKPVALVGPELPKPVIVEFNAVAARSGVNTGLTASQATARCAELIIKSRSPAQEQAATEILLQTAFGFAANIESTAPGVCTMELKGLGLQTHGELARWAENFLAAFAALHLEAQIGIAATPALALLAARGAKGISIIDDPAEFISVLPLAALEPAPEIAEILRRWGIHTAGQFLALDKDDVAERLGAEALELFDCVSTGMTRPLKLVLPPEEFTEQIEFEKEIETAEPLLFVLRRFVEQLSRRLETVYLVVAELHLRLGLVSGANYERVIKIPSPTGNIETLFRALRTHLETVRTDAAIISLKLSARPSKTESHQFGLFEATVRNPNQFAETLARLGALCGSENVGMAVPAATHRPDVFSMKTPEFGAKLESSTPPPTGLALRRFRPVLDATVEFSGRQPSSLRCSFFNGGIVKARGPFVYSGDWWEESRWAREEWDVETPDGACFRIFRSDGGCFVEGVYD